MKATATAPSNIAFIKYWGKKDEVLRLPVNGSISMNLSRLITTTTVEFSDKLDGDSVVIDGQSNRQEARRVVRHLDLFRRLAGTQARARVQSANSFPSSRGLSSSASGFAALTVACSESLSLGLDARALSTLARQGSGSACRSIPDGFVEWTDGETSETSFARSLHPPDYWDIADVVIVTGDGKKDIPTTEGMDKVTTSPFAEARRLRMGDKIRLCKSLLAQRDFDAFGLLAESEALEMHAVMMTQTPPLLYWTCGTLHFMKMARKWRTDGLPVYFTVNTGQDIHLIVEGKNAETLQKLVEKEGIAEEVFVNGPAKGAGLADKHLF